jgi:hypothetical protein
VTWNGREFEIYSNEGNISFDLERMNELNFFSAGDPEFAQGFRNVLVTEPVHPYIDAWWPPGHIIANHSTGPHKPNPQAIVSGTDVFRD